ncbi:MAG TPA: HAD family hydrolase [Candidatus Binataceae bacterium]|nr:HAD family hydrolase [Candidatus Binataceae bacterium]
MSQAILAQARRGGWNLIFDADDTLWDSNVHFLEAQSAFFMALREAGLDDATRIYAAIRSHELSIIEEIGYGRRPYVMALRRVAEELIEPELHLRVQPLVEKIGAALLERHCELMPGVAATLAELASRHRLILFTKGQPDEQMAKLERSRLRGFFSRVGVPREKDAAAYERLVAQANLDPARTVMIGNSPRSDINPAIRAGLRAAVYIPHAQTWDLEQEELAADARILTVPSFPHLTELF